MAFSEESSSWYIMNLPGQRSNTSDCTLMREITGYSGSCAVPLLEVSQVVMSQL